jgi:regulator of RNase E activity RraA
MATKEQLQALQRYTACDISDALLKIKVPNSGFLPDLNLYTPSAASSSPHVLIAPASTVVFAPKSSSDGAGYPDANIPAGEHWVDRTEPETIVVMSQPKGQICAVLGGIMALRMKVLNAKGVVVHGRVRDMEELAATGLPVSVHFVERTSITAHQSIDLGSREVRHGRRCGSKASCHPSPVGLGWNHCEAWGPHF